MHGYAHRCAWVVFFFAKFVMFFCGIVVLRQPPTLPSPHSMSCFEIGYILSYTFENSNKLRDGVNKIMHHGKSLMTLKTFDLRIKRN